MSNFEDWISKQGSVIPPVLREQLKYAYKAGRSELEEIIQAMAGTLTELEQKLSRAQSTIFNQDEELNQLTERNAELKQEILELKMYKGEWE